jgi:hypothetical protein
MTDRLDHVTRTPPADPQQDRRGHTGHGWMMIACCVPMLVIAIVLVAAGAVSVSWLFTALMCAAMMALMMGGMQSR